MYQVQKLRNTTTTTATTITTTTTWDHRWFQGEVLAKTPGLYQVPKLKNTTTTTTTATTTITAATTNSTAQGHERLRGGGHRKNLRFLSSPKAE